MFSIKPDNYGDVLENFRLCHLSTTSWLSELIAILSTPPLLSLKLRRFGSLCRSAKLFSRPHQRRFNLFIHFYSDIVGHSHKHPRKGVDTGCRSSWCVRHHPIGHYSRKSCSIPTTTVIFGTKASIPITILPRNIAQLRLYSFNILQFQLPMAQQPK